MFKCINRLSASLRQSTAKRLPKELEAFGLWVHTAANLAETWELYSLFECIGRLS